MKWFHDLFKPQRKKHVFATTLPPLPAIKVSLQDEQLGILLQQWLAVTDHRQGRIFLSEHPELLTSPVAEILDALIHQAGDQPRRLNDLLLHRAILAYARQHSGTVDAIRAACVNVYGGFVLDMPKWLNELCTQDETLSQQGRSDQITLTRVACWEQARAKVQHEDLAPEILAEIDIRLSDALKDCTDIDRPQQLEACIIALRSSEIVYSRDIYPFQQARIQHKLGTVYWYRHLGERAKNLEMAIAAYETALDIRTQDTVPYEWANTQNNLGLAYQDRILGDRAENLERAITAYAATLEVHSRNIYPHEWADTQNNLGITYRDRIHGNRAENLERAIAAYEAALEVYSRDAYPHEWANIQNNLGNAYQGRIHGDRAENLEQAIAIYEAALEVRTRDASPYHWAQTQSNLGLTYQDRIRGERTQNLERAISAYEMALEIRNRDASPFEWALVQKQLGDVYIHHTHSGRSENQERAIAAYKSALAVYTPDAFPTECRRTTYALAKVLMEQGQWAEAEVRFATAVAIETDLFMLAAGAEGRDAILREWSNAAEYQAFALTRLGQLADAAVAVEAGRARSLAEARRFDRADPHRIADRDRRQRYEAALAAFRAAQATLQQPDKISQRKVYLAASASYRAERARFDAIVAEIQAAHDPADFIQPAITSADLLRVTSQVAQGHAIIYLLVTPWGGVALGGLTANHDMGMGDRFSALALPDLTTALVDDLLEQRHADGSHRLLGGYGIAQESALLDRLCAWPGATLAEKIAALEAAAHTLDKESLLAQATQAALAIPALQPQATSDITHLTEDERHRLECQVQHIFLQLELRRSFATLARVALSPLAAWLREEGVTSVTLVPSGLLATFPLLTIPINSHYTECQTLGDILPASIAPSAFTLTHGKQSNIQRGGVSAVGNPQTALPQLDWGEAEALTLVYLSGDQQRVRARIGFDATRAWFIEAASHASVFIASCHGHASGEDFLQYRLLLANGESLTLADALNGVVDLRGMRLLILSACQTSLVNVRGAQNEMRSLGVGMLQAGADAVLAALWPVDDRATYLLIVRFAQEWFPVMDREPPATALIRAQRWLREVTWSELRDWVARDLLPVVASDPLLSQQVPHVAEEYSLVMKRANDHYGYYPYDLVLPRSKRLGIGMAESLIHEQARRQHPDERPFVDPYYWAAFHITGW